jgi:uncharacterized coiled-coil protein SlyX
MPTGDSRRIEALEVKIAFVEHTVLQLDDVLRALRGQVEAIQRDVQSLQEQQQAMMPPVEDAKPPHW